jgi:pathogenesis-related protein 1
MDPNNPQYSHYTQMVWKSTKEIGCAITACASPALLLASLRSI